MVVMVILQVSALYSNTGFTMVLKILIMVLIPNSEECQMFFSWRKVVLALLIDILASASVPACLSFILPK